MSEKLIDKKLQCVRNELNELENQIPEDYDTWRTKIRALLKLEQALVICREEV